MTRRRMNRSDPLTPHDAPEGPAVHSAPMLPAQFTRVGKSMRPGQPGTRRLLQRYGAHLLQVRHRYDWTGLYRYTTVELMVDVVPVTHGPCLTARYGVRLKSNESTLLAQARGLGARWEPTLLCWTLPGKAVQTLGLAHRVESATMPHRLHRRQRRSKT